MVALNLLLLVLAWAPHVGAVKAQVGSPGGPWIVAAGSELWLVSESNPFNNNIWHCYRATMGKAACWHVPTNQKEPHP